MTKKNALETAIATLKAAETPDTDAIATLENMIVQLDKARKPMSEETKAALAAKTKAARSEARAALMSTVAPVLRAHLAGHTADTALTARELFTECSAELPTDWTWQKVQSALTRDMKSEVGVVEGTKKAPANRYYLA